MPKVNTQCNRRSYVKDKPTKPNVGTVLLTQAGVGSLTGAKLPKIRTHCQEAPFSQVLLKFSGFTAASSMSEAGGVLRARVHHAHAQVRMCRRACAHTHNRAHVHTYTRTNPPASAVPCCPLAHLPTAAKQLLAARQRHLQAPARNGDDTMAWVTL